MPPQEATARSMPTLDRSIRNVAPQPLPDSAPPGRTSERLLLDILFRQSLVHSLVAQRLDRGMHRYAWDLRSAGGREVGSGVYFTKLNTPAGTRITRLVVVR